MGLTLYEEDIEFKVSAKRLWFASIKDAHNCSLKYNNDKIETVEYEGDHHHHALKVDAVRVIKYHQGLHEFIRIKEKFEEVDEEKLKVKLSVIEGGFLGLHFSHYKYALEFKESPHGCTLHLSIEYHALGGHHKEHHEIKGVILEYLETCETYLLSNNDYE